MVLVLVVQVVLPVGLVVVEVVAMVLMAGVQAYPVKEIMVVHHRQAVIHQEGEVVRVPLVRLLQLVILVAMVVQVLHHLYQVRQ